jgi:hypothetical protein
MSIAREELNKIYNQRGFEILPDWAVVQEGDWINAISNGLTAWIPKENRFSGMVECHNHHIGEIVNPYESYGRSIYFIRPLPVKPKKERKPPKVYYKVVDRSDYGLYSARSEFNKVEYKVNEWVQAPGNTRLFVFDSLYQAEQFQFRDEEIYTCQAQHVSTGYGIESSCRQQEFWNFIEKHSKGRHITKAIDKANKTFHPTMYKAVLARRVKLLEKV